MKMEVLYVPKGKCPLDFLAEQGERIRNSWIFLSEDVFDDLWVRCKEGRNILHNGTVYFKWEATKDYPSTEVFVNNFSNKWNYISRISADDIAFTEMTEEPEEILLIKMDK